MKKSPSKKRMYISKKLRFEVFKRDKFTCAYCGRKAPDVVLEVDHINPVAKGGDDNITNLITSCYDCNRGKRDIPLQLNEAVEKQRKQMELLQEKREQLEMLFEWKKSLDGLKDYKNNLFIEYIEDKISPYTLKKHYIEKIIKLFSKHQDEEVLDAINIAANNYLKYSPNDELERDSVEEFLNKVGGVLINKSLPPIKQKLAYIKGICRNRFNYWDSQKGSIILNNYVQALKNQNWSDSKILDDLETEVIRVAKESKNWSEWRNIIEGWTESINSWSNELNEVCDLSEQDIKEMADRTYSQLLLYFEFIKFVSKIYSNENEEKVLAKTISVIKTYIEKQLEKLGKNEDIQELKPSIMNFRSDGLLYFIDNIDTPIKFIMQDVIRSYTRKFFEEELFLPNLNLNDYDSAELFVSIIEKKLNDNTNDR